MNRQSIHVAPVATALGAEVSGVDLSSAIDETVLAAIRRALVEHQVLFFRNQRLTPAQHIAFSARLGPLLRVPYVKPLPRYPEIVAVLKEADEHHISPFGSVWHSDFSFLERPPSLSTLYALEVPPCGGDTLWANTCLGYESLSAGLRTLLEGMRALHAGVPYGIRAAPADATATSRSMDITRNDPAADAEVAHPVVRVHPESGRRALFVNPVYTTRFEGMTVEESKPLLGYLYAQAVRPELTCRYRWQPQTLAVWDNRCTMHLAVNDYDGHRRLMHRTTMAGERPR
jgi:taurine dioxygenase